MHVIRPHRLLLAGAILAATLAATSCVRERGGDQRAAQPLRVVASAPYYGPLVGKRTDFGMPTVPLLTLETGCQRRADGNVSVETTLTLTGDRPTYLWDPPVRISIYTVDGQLRAIYPTDDSQPDPPPRLLLKPGSPHTQSVTIPEGSDIATIAIYTAGPRTDLPWASVP